MTPSQIQYQPWNFKSNLLIGNISAAKTPWFTEKVAVKKTPQKSTIIGNSPAKYSVDFSAEFFQCVGFMLRDFSEIQIPQK